MSDGHTDYGALVTPLRLHRSVVHLLWSAFLPRTELTIAGITQAWHDIGMLVEIVVDRS